MSVITTLLSTSNLTFIDLDDPPGEWQEGLLLSRSSSGFWSMAEVSPRPFTHTPSLYPGLEFKEKKIKGVLECFSHSLFFSRRGLLLLPISFPVPLPLPRVDVYTRGHVSLDITQDLYGKQKACTLACRDSFLSPHTRGVVLSTS